MDPNAIDPLQKETKMGAPTGDAITSCRTLHTKTLGTISA